MVLGLEATATAEPAGPVEGIFDFLLPVMMAASDTGGRFKEPATARDPLVYAAADSDPGSASSITVTGPSVFGDSDVQAAVHTGLHCMHPLE